MIRILITRSCELLDKELRSSGYVELINAPDKQQLVQEFHSADGFIWPSQSDQNCAYLLRAMASALPIICPDAHQVKKYAGEKLRNFHLGDANDLANSLERSMADVHFRILSSSRNHKNAMSFTYEHAAMRLFTVLRAYGGNHASTTVLAS